MIRRTLNILIADDDDGDRAQIRRALEKAGLSAACTETVSVQEALDACNTRAFDCAFVDYRLPGEDGLAGISALHARLPHMAIIMSTRHGDEAVATDAMKRGASDYIAKAQITAASIKHIIEGAVEKAFLQQKVTQQKEELERFAYLLAHDLKAPARAMHMYARSIEEAIHTGNIDNGGTVSDCQRMVNAAERMVRLIDTLYQYTKINARVALEPIEMRQMMKDALSNLEHLLRERGAQVTHGELPTVICNGPQITQLLQNLIGNGIKYCAMAVPSVHVAACHYGQSAWLISLKDNGIGIPKEYYETVFEPFRRLHSTDEYERTGLGLAACKKIIEGHEGSIWCESEAGQGTTFFFTLPGIEGDS